MKRVGQQIKLLQREQVIAEVRKDTLIVPRKNKDAFLRQAQAVNGAVHLCIIRSLGGIGDILMITPTLRELKARFPRSKITFAIDRHRTNGDVYYELVRNAPFIDEIIDARYVDPSKYDAYADISAVCIPHERKELPAINRIDLFARSLGIHSLANKMPFYAVLPEEQVAAKCIVNSLRTNESTKVVALHTASFDGQRTWPIEKYLELVSQAQVKATHVQFIVLDFNRAFTHWDSYPNVYNASFISVREMSALIEQVDLFIGPDSGPMHLAGAVSTKSLVLFGSIPPKSRINYYPTHTAITLEGLKCLGCWYVSCPRQTKCMAELSSQVVFNRLQLALSEL